VAEYFGMTELKLTAVTTTATVGPIVAPVMLSVPAAGETAAAAYLERHEGMRVALPPQVFVAGTNHFGTAYSVAASTGRTALYRGEDLAPRLGLTRPLGWLCAKQGDSAAAVAGALAFVGGVFTVVLDVDQPPAIVDGGRRPDEPPGPAAADEVTVATYNVENFFDHDPPGPVPGPVPYPAEVARRARSIALGLGAPDVVALQEVENRRVLDDLVARPELASAGYEPVHVEGPDSRGIDVALLYKRALFELLTVTTHQRCTTLQPPVVPDQHCLLPGGGEGNILFGRPPLEVALRHLASGTVLVVVVNHFKSMSGGGPTGSARVEQARVTREVATHVRAEQPAARLVVLGDLNDFEDSAMMGELTAGGALVNLHPRPLPVEDYSYVFSGVRQVLDHILVPPDQPTRDFRAQHVNADFCAPAPDDPSEDAQHVSDHDPLFVRLVLDGTPVQHAVYLPTLLRLAAVRPEPTLSPRPSPAPSATREAPSPTPKPDLPTPTASATPTSSSGSPPRTPLQLLDVFYDGVVNANEPDEYVSFRNVSNAEVDLTGWHLVSVQGDQRYGFPAGQRIAAGQTCRVYTDELHPEHCGLSWHSGQAIWRNAGDKAELRDGAGRLIDHLCYGDREGECP
jgi:endonuclease/exonuclease/phosphatase family metal-dependent hydrolase